MVALEDKEKQDFLAKITAISADGENIFSVGNDRIMVDLFLGVVEDDGDACNKLSDVIEGFFAPTNAGDAGSLKPSFNELISMQDSSGHWDKASGETLRKYFQGQALSDLAVLCILEKQQLDAAVMDRVYHTLLALYILKEVFSQRREEWSLLEKKAMQVLSRLGLKRADKVLAEFTLKIK